MEHGFWDYTTPGSGGMSGYGRDEYVRLLDDMAGAGMGSLAVVVRWLTTGYRSRLSFLDQIESNPVIASGNDLLREVIDEAHARKIDVWLVANGNRMPVDRVTAEPLGTHDIDSFPGMEVATGAGIGRVGVYEIDTPEIVDAILAQFGEIVSEFPALDGLVVEVEHCDGETPARREGYAAWAEANGKPPLESIGRPLCPRMNTIAPWREYTSWRRARLCGKIEAHVRALGCTGRLAMICETGRQPYTIHQAVDLERLHRACPAYEAVSYECGYVKKRNRYGMMEMAIDEPKRVGMFTWYLPRGVMTWCWPEAERVPGALEDFWRLELEDIARFRPDGVWWFGSGCAADGAHVTSGVLRKMGFESGDAARRALLRVLAETAA